MTEEGSLQKQGFLPATSLSSQLYGQEQAEKTFLRAWQRDLLAHAWLLQGMRGTGKATFAYRAARALLSQRGSISAEALTIASNPSGAVFHQLAAGTHPDCSVIASEGEKEITVDQAREMVRFFYKTPVVSRYRIGIVDSADRLNREAANALLKTVEEPGRFVVLFLVCHASEALLPTLRSRCRTLLFQPVAEEKINDFLRTHGAESTTANTIAALSCGSFYYAGLLAEAGGENFLKAFADALSMRLTRKSTGKNATAFADMLGDKAFVEERPEAFRFLWQRFLSCAVQAAAQAHAQRGTGDKRKQEVDRKKSADETLLGLLSPSARESVARAPVAFWQGLWQRSVPHLLASRAARGGDFVLSANYALESLRETGR